MAPVTDPIDVPALRKDFPLLARGEADRPLVYLDSAASAQRPQSVLDAMDHYYATTHANVHRGVYAIAEEATRQLEAARVRLGRFIGAPHPDREVVFTKNATEAINLAAFAWGRENLCPGDVVVLSEIEHHANLVPWLMLKDELGIELRYIPLGADFHLDLSQLDRLVAGAKLVGVTAASNVLGTVVDLDPIVAAAHGAGALVLVDGAQLAPHRRVDVAALGVDFFALTGHKMLGPTGIGALWARTELLETMPPFLGGGEMISTVSYEHTTWAAVPHKFEAGTPPILESIGLGAAIRWFEGLGYAAVAAHERALTDHALSRLSAIEGVTILGHAQDRGGVISFTMHNAHAHDIATLLDRQGIAVRAGHHCAEPLMGRMGVTSTARASFGMYTTAEEIDALAAGLNRIRQIFE